MIEPTEIKESLNRVVLSKKTKFVFIACWSFLLQFAHQCEWEQQVVAVVFVEDSLRYVAYLFTFWRFTNAEIKWRRRCPGVPAELIFFLKLRFFGTRKPSAGIEPPSYSQSRQTSSNYFSYSIMNKSRIKSMKLISNQLIRKTNQRTTDSAGDFDH